MWPNSPLAYDKDLLTASNARPREDRVSPKRPAVATFGLLSAIRERSQFRSNSVSFAAGAFITAAYWFTTSTSFTNPAVTIARRSVIPVPGSGTPMRLPSLLLNSPER